MGRKNLPRLFSGGDPVHKAGESLDAQITLVGPSWPDRLGVSGNIPYELFAVRARRAKKLLA